MKENRNDGRNAGSIGRITCRDWNTTANEIQKHNINDSIVQFNTADRSPSCHGDRRRQQVDRHWRLRQVGGRTVSARSVLLRPVAVDTARLLAAQKLQSAELAPVLPGGSRWESPRGRCVAVDDDAAATAPRCVRRPCKRRRVPQRVLHRPWPPRVAHLCARTRRRGRSERDPRDPGTIGRHAHVQGELERVPATAAADACA